MAARVSQAPVEVVIAPTSVSARVSQAPVEVVYIPKNILPATAHLILTGHPPDASTHTFRVTQTVIEAALSGIPSNLRVTQSVAEVVAYPTSEALRVSQHVVEVLVNGAVVTTLTNTCLDPVGTAIIPAARSRTTCIEAHETVAQVSARGRLTGIFATDVSAQVKAKHYGAYAKPTPGQAVARNRATNFITQPTATPATARSRTTCIEAHETPGQIRAVPHPTVLVYSTGVRVTQNTVEVVVAPTSGQLRATQMVVEVLTK